MFDLKGLDFKKIGEAILSSHKLKYAFGLDIGSFSVKAAQIKKGLAKGNGQFYFAVATIIKEGDRQAIITAIKEASKALNTDSKRVNISLSGQNVIARYILIPKMAEKDLKNSLEFELTKHMPQKFEDMVIDYQVIDKSVGAQMSVTVVGAERKFINERVNLVKEAGLEVHSVNVDCFAVSEIFRSANSAMVKGAEAIALLNIGHRITNLSVLENDVLHFSRDIIFGGFDISKAISERMSMDFSAADRLKCGLGELVPESDKVVKSALSSLVDEIRLSFDYCERLIQKKVSAIFLSGGSAYLNDIDALLGSALAIKVNFWDPLAGFKLAQGGASCDPKASGRSLAVAAALAY